MEQPEQTASLVEKRWSHDFREGFVAMLPLWAGAIPAGFAFGIAARAVGMGAIDAQVMSLTVFTAAGQITAVSMLGDESAFIAIFVTVMAVNAQLPLLGIAAARQLKPTPFQKVQLALLLTDGAYAIAAARNPLRHYVLIGAGLSMYMGWNLGTTLGLAIGGSVANVSGSGLDFVVPLSFLAVLVPLVRDLPALVSILVAASVALLSLEFAPVGVAVLAAGITGSLAGVVAERREDGTG